MNQPKISLEKHFAFIREPGPVLVAVSGGSDSMALLFLANAWAQRTGREIQAITVDHGLRAEAASEAIYVASVCEQLGVSHTILAWDGVKPATGISAAARNARYQLINEFARDIGVSLILTGHTQDDQAETVLMRMRRGQHDLACGGGRGHAGMDKRVLLGGLGVYQNDGTGLSLFDAPYLLRPLLGVARQELRDYLNGISQSWIEDPSNFDRSYERVRVRSELAKNPVLKTSLLKYSSVMGRLRAVVAQDASNWLMHNCKVSAERIFQFDGAHLMCLAQPVSYMAMKSVIALAGGGAHLVTDKRIAAILDMIGGRANERLTIGNCVIEVKGGLVSILREHRNLLPMLIASGESAYWDGRVHITNLGTETLRVEGLPSDQLDLRQQGKAKGTLKMTRLQRTACLSAPYISTRSGLSVALFVDQAHEIPDQICVRLGAQAIELFCPHWDFSLLDWMSSVDHFSMPYDGKNSQSALDLGDESPEIC